MIYRKIFIGILALLILLANTFACSSTKDVEERKNLMMPKKSEMSRNSRYREVEKRKTNKIKHPKHGKKKIF